MDGMIYMRIQISVHFLKGAIKSAWTIHVLPILSPLYARMSEIEK